jgi:hypothetical protein
MSIFVVCPGCRKRFEVSEQFAGRTGPCPSCKTQLTIPKAEEQVVVHGPAQAPPGKTRTGAAAPKPVARTEARFQPITAVAIGAGALVVSVVTLAARGVLQEYWLLRAVGLLLVSPPLVLGGYAFLRDDEREPYRGRELYVRAGILATVFAALWAGFGRVESTFLTGEMWQWLFVAPPLFVVGALAALACLDFDFGSGFFLYSFYVAATVLLRWLAGLGWVWNAGIGLDVAQAF